MTFQSLVKSVLKQESHALKYWVFCTVFVKVAALREHYKNLNANEKKLKRADFLGHTVIPTIACCFIGGYWILGMMKYYSPDWVAYQDLVPQFQVNKLCLAWYYSQVHTRMMHHIMICWRLQLGTSSHSLQKILLWWWVLRKLDKM